jgi:hypothetical protein
MVLTQERSHGRRRQVAEKPAFRRNEAAKLPRSGLFVKLESHSLEISKHKLVICLPIR